MKDFKLILLLCLLFVKQSTQQMKGDDESNSSKVFEQILSEAQKEIEKLSEIKKEIENQKKQKPDQLFGARHDKA